MKKQIILIVILSVIAVAGGLTGSYFYQQSQGGGTITTDGSSGGEAVTAVVAEEGQVKNGDVFGSSNTDDFKDNAQGYLIAGGMDGEGSHQLLRAGGDSQTVYLTSSVTDMSEFEGMEIKVWGESHAGENVGWLMDVGRVEVINTQGESPVEE